MNISTNIQTHNLCDNSINLANAKDNSFILISYPNIDSDETATLLNISDIYANYDFVSSNINNSTNDKYAKKFLETIDDIANKKNTETTNEYSSKTQIKNAEIAEESLNYIKQEILDKSTEGLQISAKQSPAIVINLV